MLKNRRVEPRTALINAAVTEAERKAIFRAAEKRDMSASALVREALRKELGVEELKMRE